MPIIVTLAVMLGGFLVGFGVQSIAAEYTHTDASLKSAIFIILGIIIWLAIALIHVF